MIKKIFLVLLCVVGASLGADITWDGSASGKWSTADNWVGGVVPGASDIARLDGAVTDNNCTLDVNIRVDKIIIESDFTGDFRALGRLDTVLTAFIDSGDGTLRNYGLRMVMEGDGRFYTNCGATATFSSACSLLFKGKDTLDLDKTGQTFAKLMVDDTLYITNGATSAIALAAGIPPAVKLANNALINHTGNTITVTNVSGTGGLWQFGNGAAINGDGAIVWSFNNTTNPIPCSTMTVTGTNAITIQPNSTADSMVLYGNLSLGSAALTWRPTSARTTNYSLNANSKNITCGALTVGSTNGAQTIKYRFSRGTINTGAVTFSGTGVDSVWLDTAIWRAAGNWAYVAPGASDKLMPGLSQIRMVGTAAQTFGTTNHTTGAHVWWDSTATGYKTSLTDSVTADTMLIHGGFKSATFNMSRLLYFEIDSKAEPCSLGTGIMTFTQPKSKFYYKSGMPRDMKRMSLNFTQGLEIKSDTSNMTFLRIKDGAAHDTLILPAGKIIKDSTYVAADHDSLYIISSQSGTAARFDVPSGLVYANTRLKDIKFQRNMVFDTLYSGGLNLGGDSNVIFKDAAGAKYLTPSYPTITTLTPDTGTDAGGSVITITGTELFAPCSISLDTTNTWIVVTVIDSTTGTFVTPAKGTGGVIRRVDLKNADGNTVTKLAAFTYNIASAIINSIRRFFHFGYRRGF